MRVALRCFSSVGVRAARVLAADPNVEQVGIVSGSGQLPREQPEIAASEIADWDVFGTDGELPPDWDQMPPRVVASRSGGAPEKGRQLISGANAVTGIGGSLASLEIRRFDGPSEIRLAYTSQGSALRHGERLRFPDPVGVRYGRQASRSMLPGEVVRSVEAPGPDPWAGLLVEVWRDEIPIRVVGVSDDRLFLEAIALASGVSTAGKSAYPASARAAYEAPAVFVEAAVGSGLTVASYSSES